MTADASKAWWQQPYRIVQTNLRLIDATLDPTTGDVVVRAPGPRATIDSPELVAVSGLAESRQ